MQLGAQVRLRGFFQPNSPWWVKKTQPNPTQPNVGVQPNPTHMDRIGHTGWKFFFLIIIISTIIKLNIRTTLPQIKVNL